MVALLAGMVLVGGCSSADPGDAVDESVPVADEDDAAAPDGEPAGTASEEPGEEEPAEDVATIDPPLDLAGTRWVPTNFNYNPGNTGITNPIAQDVVFLEFAADGTLRGHTGCNEFEGAWEITGPYYDYDEAAEAFEDRIDGQPLSISAERTTDDECEGFLAEDDVNLLGALVATELWFIGNDLGDQEDGIVLHGNGARVYADPA